MHNILTAYADCRLVIVCCPIAEATLGQCSTHLSIFDGVYVGAQNEGTSRAASTNPPMGDSQEAAVPRFEAMADVVMAIDGKTAGG